MIKNLKYLSLFVIYFTHELIRHHVNSVIIPFRFNLIKFLKHKLNKNYNPFNDENFQSFITENNKLWLNSSNNYSDKENILVTSLIHSHSGFSFYEALISKYLSMSKKKI